jgi:LmbE family N-acetylglucosaminyl deacetylase
MIVKEFSRLQFSRILAALLRANSRPFPFRFGRVLVVAPHADDETLGCGGLIAAYRQRDWPVEVAFLTDSAGPRASLDLARSRRNEALTALRELGVAAASAYFLNAPDGHLPQAGLAACVAATNRLAELIRQFQPTIILTPYLGGGSSEHDAAYWMVDEARSAAGSAAAVWEYPVWAWWNRFRLRRQLLRAGENFHHELGSLRQVKLRALDQHRSQLAELPPTLVALSAAPIEFYFRRRP